MQAPTVNVQHPRTSGYALASTVLALVLAFTGIGTVIAVVLGVLGLVSISRHRGQVAGTGYALFGIIWGVLFTGVFALAIVKGELFGVGDVVREQMLGNEVEKGGPLEVQRPGDGYAITRPSSKWAVAKSGLAQKLVDNRNDLVLINLSRDAYIDISRESLNFDTFDAYREGVLDRFREGRHGTGGDRQNSAAPYQPECAAQPPGAFQRRLGTGRNPAGRESGRGQHHFPGADDPSARQRNGLPGPCLGGPAKVHGPGSRNPQVAR